jgi:hypothetical protein
MNNEQNIVLKGGEVSDVLARLTTKGFLALLAVLLFAIVGLIRHGATSDYLLLLAGTIFSAMAMLAYTIPLFTKKKSIPLAIAAFGGFIPYLFGLYLVFYRGFWRLKDLSVGFSIAIIIEGTCFVLAGYVVVSGIYKLSKFARKVDDGKILIR